MNDTHPRRRNPRPGRARKRAIREQAARTGVPYSVAARVIADLGLQPGESVASHGRTIYPADPLRQSLVEQRERRSFTERLADTRLAASLPAGRPHHLVNRFPPGRGLTGSGVGRLYHGEGRPELLTMLYLAVAAESPALLPDPAGLAWVAEMAEETAVDMECAELDRAARSMLENDTSTLWPRLAASVKSALSSPDPLLRQAATTLTTAQAQPTTITPTRSSPDEAITSTRPSLDAAVTSTRPSPDAAITSTRSSPGAAITHLAAAAALPSPSAPPFDGVRQILDALLMVAEDGHAPGTRVRVLAGPNRGRTATIITAVWGAAGPPIAYRVQLDGATTTLGMAAGELIVLAGQESHPA
ncbi:hypothetical protein ACTI_48750 [Actinoplanes sp. OR16]|uniref:hypothetical protein n=1 Tax=Actinoplanes sp. OR16 TaxID=946334 RepID=UPI000F6D8E40|nr:hypothetical protein [Actinoplanes sp. OR16]BBH68190.1 hypothetical protein ACTI_48750 [Actinoplanes sp. OR16]